MKLIVGLGNIGTKYEDTNHNAGFMVVDAVAQHYGVKFNNRSCDADWGDYRNLNDKFIFAKPRTYMNNSGLSVKSFINKYDIDITDVVVINDDIDQEPGNIRIRKNGSAGTHNGLKSIIAETGSQITRAGYCAYSGSRMLIQSGSCGGISLCSAGRTQSPFEDVRRFYFCVLSEFEHSDVFGERCSTESALHISDGKAIRYYSL